MLLRFGTGSISFYFALSIFTFSYFDFLSKLFVRFALMEDETLSPKLKLLASYLIWKSSPLDIPILKEKYERYVPPSR